MNAGWMTAALAAAQLAALLHGQTVPWSAAGCGHGCGQAVRTTGAWHEETAFPGDGRLHDLIAAAERQVEQGNWERARETVDALEHRIRKRFWMLMLLGDEEEYETLGRDLARLRLVVRERSRMESLQLLTDIRSVLGNIYSL